METTDATEDDAGEVDTEEIAEKKAAESDVPTIQTPIEDVGEADKTTKDGFNVPAAGQANTHGEGVATDSNMGEHDEHTVEVAERNIDKSKEPPSDTSRFLDEMKAEADTRTDHQAASDPGAVEDWPAQRAQYVQRDGELQHESPGPRGR